MAVDLSTRYLGLELRNPLVVSSCPLTGRVESIVALAQAGAAAVVLPSLFEEQIEAEEMDLHLLHEGPANAFPEATDYLPKMPDYAIGPQRYLDHIAAAKAAVDIPIIASLNGDTAGGWTHYAELMQAAGADAIELNIYTVATEPETTSQQVEQVYVDLVRQVRGAIDVPLAVKIAPYFSALPNLVARLGEAGADGFALFNRFLHLDIDLETLAVVPAIALSQPFESRRSIKWISLLRDRVTASLAATTGVHGVDDVLKLLLVGADVTMMASALHQHGVGVLAETLSALASWLEARGYTSVRQMQGSLSRANAPDPTAFTRDNYMRTLSGFASERW